MTSLPRRALRVPRWWFRNAKQTMELLPISQGRGVLHQLAGNAVCNDAHRSGLGVAPSSRWYPAGAKPAWIPPSKRRNWRAKAWSVHQDGIAGNTHPATVGVSDRYIPRYQRPVFLKSALVKPAHVLPEQIFVVCVTEFQAPLIRALLRCRCRGCFCRPERTDPQHRRRVAHGSDPLKACSER